MHPEAERRRVIIEGIQPAIDAGRFPIKRTIGEQVVVDAVEVYDGELAAAMRGQHHHFAHFGPVPPVRFRLEHQLSAADDALVVSFARHEDNPAAGLDLRAEAVPVAGGFCVGQRRKKSERCAAVHA